MNKLRKASLWLDNFTDSSGDFLSYLKTIYGNDLPLIM